MQRASVRTAYKHNFDPLMELRDTPDQDRPNFVPVLYVFFPLFVRAFNRVHHPFL